MYVRDQLKDEQTRARPEFDDYGLVRVLVRSSHNVLIRCVNNSGQT
jgi:hypothetical protein